MNQLYDFQKAAVKHLLSQPFGMPHSLLADAPGCGKTISAIQAAKESGCKTGIIVVPAIIKEQWKHQMVKWGLCGEDEIQVLYGLDAHITSQPWIVINYELVRTFRLREQLLKRKYHALILDEVQRLKTHGSQQTHSIFRKGTGLANNCYWKWALSGTIMPNRPLELYPILKTLAPQVIKPYDNWSQYIAHYCGGAYNQGRGASNIGELTEKLQPFMLRRSLEDVWPDKPPLIENEVWLDVPYDKHPEYLGDGFMEAPTLRRVIAEAKIPQIANYIQDRLDSGIDKILVFTYHREVIGQISKRFPKFAKVYGGMTPKQRIDNVNEFLTNPICHVIMIQIGSGGEGLDSLQEVCNEVIEAEPEWSPGKEDQAIARIMRLGQTRPVILTKLLATNSYEETIHGTSYQKRKVIDIITKPNGGTFTMAKAKTTNQEFSIEENIERIALNMELLLRALMQVPGIATAVPIAGTVKAGPSPNAVHVPYEPSMAERAATNFEKATSGPDALLAAPVPAGIAPPEAPDGSRRKAFEDEVLATLKAKPGEEGLKMFQNTLAFFGCTRLGELPEEKFAAFLGVIK